MINERKLVSSEETLVCQKRSSWFLGKHTLVAALTAAMEACFGTWFDPVQNDARGRISLRCSRKVVGALRKGILVGGRSVRAESEEPSDDEDVARRPKGGAKETRGSAARGKAWASAEAYGAMGVLPRETEAAGSRVGRRHGHGAPQA